MWGICLAWVAMTTFSTLLFYFYLVAWLILLSAGLLAIWDLISYVVARRRMSNESTVPIPARLWIPWRHLVIWVRMVRASRWVKRHTVSLAILFGVTAGM